MPGTLQSTKEAASVGLGTFPISQPKMPFAAPSSPKCLVRITVFFIGSCFGSLSLLKSRVQVMSGIKAAVL